ncbi:hypothetical protein [Burkholderia cepacia]|uniref:hypothetical protein n=1 Tax=Burkholderia cepacia TaxID=292 RepID=UPI0005B37CC0|nr:hypothetical protein [Burkholderia cepacia]KAB1592980.1 hypothetical protein C5O75_009890 [Burkholderia cepacia]KVL08538.1 hypothetical protein WJ46_34725 [Burkholderia cepacia]KWB25233.1 hypothetical protein WL32_04120 [Burkholderia cepacia]MCA8351530.1 hypothetical protein [Burkholderia cepacia]MDN7440556.1 hypothetical protein [Burkholderia cepacia]
MFFSLSSDGANPRRMDPTTHAAPGRRARASLPAGGAPRDDARTGMVRASCHANPTFALCRRDRRHCRRSTLLVRIVPNRKQKSD